MSRAIKKKIIDDSLKFSDDFDESMLDRIESELEGDTDAGTEASLKRRRERTAGGPDIDKSGFPTATFESPTAAESDQLRIPDEPRERPEVSPEVTVPEKISIYRKIISKRGLAIVLAVVLFVVLPFAAWFRIQSHQNQTPIVQFVRHPVPIPLLQLGTKFMMLAGPESKQDIIEIGVQFDFLSTNSYELFKEQRTYFLDKCYQYLKANGPKDSSQKHWTKLVQQDLLKHLQKESPRTHIETITVTEFTRL